MFISSYIYIYIYISSVYIIRQYISYVYIYYIMFKSFDGGLTCPKELDG